MMKNSSLQHGRRAKGRVIAVNLIQDAQGGVKLANASQPPCGCFSGQTRTVVHDINSLCCCPTLASLLALLQS